jgi:glutamate-5-semialdehyde dehydrogenase
MTDYDNGELAMAAEAVAVAARAAHRASGDLAAASDEQIDTALRAMARRLESAAEAVLAANRQDVQAGQAAGLGTGLLDRLRLDQARLPPRRRPSSGSGSCPAGWW